MSTPRSSSRGPPSRPHSTHSTHSEGTYQPPSSSTQGESDYDFCNSFWVTPQRSRRDGRDSDSEEKDWGREGYECLMSRVKAGSKVLDDLRGVLKERWVSYFFYVRDGGRGGAMLTDFEWKRLCRASIEEDYAKRLSKLSKTTFGTGETG